MKKQKIVSAIVYVTSTLCLFWHLDFLFGLDGLMSRLVYLLIAGAALFGIAAVLSFFSLRWASLCALAAAALSWPLLAPLLGNLDWGRSVAWSITHDPDTLAAMLSLTVSSLYGIRQLWITVRKGSEVRKNVSTWGPAAAALYSIATIGLANWPGIWDWLFKLRYGN